MDKFLTFPNSRIPIWQNDFAFLQNSMIDGLALAVKSIMNSSDRKANKVILYGCSVTKDNNEYMTSDGLVMIDGELLEVQASMQGENFESTPTFVLDESYNPDGDRTDFDGNSRRCYGIRRAKLGVGAISSDVYYRLPVVNRGFRLDGRIRVDRELSSVRIRIGGRFTLSASSEPGTTLLLSTRISENTAPDKFRNLCQVLDWNPDYADSGSVSNKKPFMAMSITEKKVYPACFSFSYSYNTREFVIEIYLLEALSENQFEIDADYPID